MVILYLLLDLVLIFEEFGVKDVLNNLKLMVVEVECCGYECVWLVEYYGMCGVVSFVILVVLMYIVNVILIIKVGVGGIMLLNYVFLVIVE